jgi:hypothetical protein
LTTSSKLSVSERMSLMIGLTVLMVPELDVEAATELAPAGEMPDVELGMGRKDVGYAEPL